MSGRSSGETAIAGDSAINTPGASTEKLPIKSEVGAPKKSAVGAGLGEGDNGVEITSVPKKLEHYDPMQESKWTRLGLTWESFKRAPGSTRGQVVHGSAIPDAEAGESEWQGRDAI